MSHAGADTEERDTDNRSVSAQVYLDPVGNDGAMGDVGGSGEAGDVPGDLPESPPRHHRSSQSRSRLSVASTTTHGTRASKGSLHSSKSGRKSKSDSLMEFLADENKAFQDYLVSTMTIARSNKMYERQRRLQALGKRNQEKARRKARKIRRQERREKRRAAREAKRLQANSRRGSVAGKWNGSVRPSPVARPVSIFYTKVRLARGGTWDGCTLSKQSNASCPLVLCVAERALGVCSWCGCVVACLRACVRACVVAG